MSDSVRPYRQQPTRLLCPWDSPGKNTGVGCHFLLLVGQSTGSQRVGHYRSYPVCIGARLFFACGSSAPVRVKHEGGTAAWLVRTLAAPNVQGHGLPPPQDLSPYQSLFEPLVAGHQKASLASLSSRLCPFRHLEGFLGWGPSLLLRCIRHIEEPLKLGSYSIEGHVRHLMGHPGWGPTL